MKEMKPLVYRLLKHMPDKLYISLQYYYTTGKILNLSNPKTFNEKLQWLKLYDRNPLYTNLVDKYLVRAYIEEKIGKRYLIPLVGVWDKPEDIDFEKLPDRFVLKCNHDSKSTRIFKDKSNLDIKEIQAFYNKRLNKNAYYYGREWPYKNVRPKIIAEKFIVERENDDLKDYKVMCFGGKAKLIQVHAGRFKGKNIYTQDFYDCDWQKLPITQGVQNSDVVLEKPHFLDEMLRLSERLSSGVPQLRVDWYHDGSQLFFGELTFFDASGYDEFVPDEYNYIVGSWIDLKK